MGLEYTYSRTKKENKKGEKRGDKTADENKVKWETNDSVNFDPRSFWGEVTDYIITIIFSNFYYVFNKPIEKLVEILKLQWIESEHGSVYTGIYINYIFTPKNRYTGAGGTRAEIFAK